MERSASVLEVFGFHPAVNRELQTQGLYVLRRAQLERLGRGISVKSVLGALNPRARDQVSSTYWYRAPEQELDRICASGAWWPSAIDGDLNL